MKQRVAPAVDCCCRGKKSGVDEAIARIIATSSGTVRVRCSGTRFKNHNYSMIIRVMYDPSERDASEKEREREGEGEGGREEGREGENLTLPEVSNLYDINSCLAARCIPPRLAI